MATFRPPFAYNPGAPIDGTTQYNDLAVGNINIDYSNNYGGVQWWASPEETTGYIIGNARPAGQPVPSGLTGTAQVGFWRSKGRTDQDFLDLANYIGAKNNQPPFATTNDAEIWLESNGYYTSFNLPTPTPTITQTMTPTVTPTQTATPTPSITASQTMTPTPSITASQTMTPTPSITASQTMTPTPSITASQTMTPTQTLTPSPTNTRTQTPTPSITASQTATPTLTRTPTPTAPSTLVVYFDISNSSSYPGSGSAITDLSGAGNNATLSGDYSYSSSNSGTIVMGGTSSLANITQNDSINIASTATAVSVVIWAKVAVGYSNSDGIWNKQLGPSTYDGYRLSVGTTNPNSLVFGFNGNSSNFNTSSASNVFTANTWAMFTTVIQGGTSFVYVNGNSTPVISQVTNDTFAAQANLQIGQSIQGDSGYIPMSWGQFRYYKGKALSTAEILTLFNADKTKYGL
jgi:hypothetical protein